MLKTSLFLCLLSRLVLAADFAVMADVPMQEQRQQSTLPGFRGLARAPCLICATAEASLNPPVEVSPILLAFHLVFKLDAYLHASGHPLSDPPLSRALRLSLVAPGAPPLTPPRESQDQESLSAWVLELQEFGVVATARQQGKGGFWGQLEVGERIRAQVNGYLTSRGENSSGAWWYATHHLEVRSNGIQPNLASPPVFFGFFSLDNALARDQKAFNRVAALPGLGFGVRARVSSEVIMTSTSGMNAGLWFNLKGGETTPAFAFTLQSLQFEL